MNAAATHDALLAAILDDPADDLRRLIYADWLEENGQSERGEFIRVQVELGRLPASQMASCREICKPPDFEGCPQRELRRREHALIAEHGYGWCDGLLGPDWKTDGSGKAGCTVRVGYFSGERETAEFALAFRRGFVAQVRCPLQAWLDHGHAIVRCQPVERVEISDKEPGKVANSYSAIASHARGR